MNSNSLGVQVIVGVRIKKTDFWEPCGHEMRCNRERHRQADPSHEFCPKCGGRFVLVEDVRPTKGLLAYAKAKNLSPDRLWSGMTRNGQGCDWEDLGIWGVMQHHEGLRHIEEKKDFDVLGFMIQNEWLDHTLRNGNFSSGLSNGMDLSHLGEISKKVLEVAKLFVSKDRLDVRVYVTVRGSLNTLTLE